MRELAGLPLLRIAPVSAAKAIGSVALAAVAVGMALFAFLVLSRDEGDDAFSLFPGLYVLDTSTGAYTQLLDTRYESNFVFAGTLDWSPDGQQLLFGGGQRGGLLVMDADGRNPRRIGDFRGPATWLPNGMIEGEGVLIDSRSGRTTPAPVPEGPRISDATWTLDRRAVAFNRWWTYEDVPPPGGRSATPREGAIGAVFVAEPGSGSERVLIDVRARAMAWSPDGRRLSLVREADGPPAEAFVELFEGGARVASLPAGATSVRSLQWSPDGGRIAFVGPNQEIRLVDLGSGASQRVAQGSNPQWSPDGRKLLMVREGKLWQVEVSSGNATLLVDAPLPMVTSAKWSPDGGFVAFHASAVERAVYVIRRDGGDERYLVPGTAPVWSPDGSRIAFQYGSDVFGGVGNLYSMKPDTSDIRFLAPLWTTDVAPGPCGGGATFDWSPDSKKVAYSSYARGGYEVRIAGLDGGDEFVANGSVPRWSPDGLSIGFNSRMPDREYPGCASEVFDIGTRQRHIAAPREALPSWSPDGRFMVTMEVGSGPDPYRLPRRIVVRLVDDGSEALSMSDSYGLTWSPDARYVAYYDIQTPVTSSAR